MSAEITGVKDGEIIIGFADLTLTQIYNKKKVLKEFKKVLQERESVRISFE